MELGGVEAATEEAIGFGIAEWGELGEGFFAVEEDEFDLGGERGVEGESAGEFEEGAGAGGGVVGADEADGGEAFSVVVGAEDGALGGGGRGEIGGGGEAGDEIDEGDGATRGLGGEGLAFDEPA